MAQRPGPPGLPPARRAARDPSGWDGVEIVPDSEEERLRNRDSDDSDVIEISSDEEPSRPKGKGRLGDRTFKVPGAWTEDANPSPSKKGGKTVQTPGTPTSSKRATATAGTPSKKKAIPQTPGTPTSTKKTVSSKRPQIVESTSADAAENEVIVPEWPTPSSKVPAKHLYSNKTRSASPTKSTHVVADDSDSDIEFISGPTPSPKPTQAKPKSQSTSKTKLQPLYDDDSEDETSDTSSSEESSMPGTPPICDVPNKYAKYWIPPRAAPSTPTGRKVATPSRTSGSGSPKKLSLAARMKLEAQERATHRVEYAQQVYSYLNRRVFKDQLPPLDKVELKWNARLLTTAGRARFHRDKDGKESSEIELSIKVVDCDERIRNTLGHEMCHLACWIIDNQIQESHGKIWHKWARKVERKDQNITISVEHTYEISYNFEWQCANCDHTVGRYTNSLDPTVTKCSWCKIGTLSPLFDPELPKNARVSKMSKLAAAKPQGSPRRPGPRSATPIYIDSSDEDALDEEPLPSSIHTQKEIYVVHDSSDSETDDKANKSITELARKFEGITIAHKSCLHARRKTRTRPQSTTELAGPSNE